MRTQANGYNKYDSATDKSWSERLFNSIFLSQFNKEKFIASNHRKPEYNCTSKHKGLSRIGLQIRIANSFAEEIFLTHISGGRVISR